MGTIGPRQSDTRVFSVLEAQTQDRNGRKLSPLMFSDPKVPLLLSVPLLEVQVVWACSKNYVAMAKRKKTIISCS